MGQAVTTYNRTARIIHWLTAIFVIGMFAVGLWMVDLSYYSQWYHTAPHWHKSIGILLTFLTIFRVIWKLKTSSPKVEGKRYEQILAHAVHHFIYVDLFLIFVSGYLISTEDGRPIEVFNWFNIPGAGQLFQEQADIAGVIHTYAAWTLIIMVSLHALAALKHHFISKDNTLNKMLGVTK
ncbi:cytochrome b [Vibrio sp.]|uniref:Cytochrome b n=1 Tax=Vibrio viridaestus TaxID=2487322 RepID=A0A3N9TCF3_9VIBR|nr:cytochrome b [Vibrio viridaestus]MDC0611464.1 cytochrome b [Vibrio sp.]RQW61841.1 cytochrome b [Vibrio viridaestus]